MGVIFGMGMRFGMVLDWVVGVRFVVVECGGVSPAPSSILVVVVDVVVFFFLFFCSSG